MPDRHVDASLAPPTLWRTLRHGTGAGATLPIRLGALQIRDERANAMTTQELRLAVGDTVTVRQPTAEEQTRYGVKAGEPVLVVQHVDRSPDVLPADSVTIAPRSYGMVPE
jgi:hypothetical protein